jgi:hypothetical protein
VSCGGHRLPRAAEAVGEGSAPGEQFLQQLEGDGVGLGQRLGRPAGERALPFRYRVGRRRRHARARAQRHVRQARHHPLLGEQRVERLRERRVLREDAAVEFLQQRDPQADAEAAGVGGAQQQLAEPARADGQARRIERRGRGEHREALAEQLERQGGA